MYRCVSFVVLLPTDPSKNSPSNCRFVLQCSSEFPDLGTRISGIVQLDLLSPLRKTPLLQRSMLSSFEAPIPISSCGYRSEPPVPSCSSSRPGRQQCRCPRRLWSCQHVSVFVISALLWAFPPGIALHVSTGQSRIREAHSFSGPNVSLFLQDPICLGPRMKASCKQICIVLHHLSSESDSVFILTPVCLLVSLVVSSLSWFSPSRLIEDEWCMSQVGFDVQVLSNLICPNSDHTV